jgi:hypothetical protein
MIISIKNSSRKMLMIVFILINHSFWAQTKKEQIELLNSRVDSLSSILTSERSINQEKTNRINELTTKSSNLESQNRTLSEQVSKLNSDLEKSNFELKILESEIETEKKELITLRALLASEKDSLGLLKNYLANSISESNILKQELDNKKKIIIDLQSKIKDASEQINTPKSQPEIEKTIPKLMIGSRELKVGDTIKYDDPDKYKWETLDMSPHYVQYRTLDGWEVVVGGSGDRYLKIEWITAP